MWKTSFIQFLKIIRQNKFFTFLNLFGMSITITIILIAALKIEATIWPGGPEINNNEMLLIKNSLIENDQYMSMGQINLQVVEDYILKMESPYAIAISSNDPWSYFGENGVEEFNIKNVNDGWWNVFDFNFTHGRAFNLTEVKNAQNVVVIDANVKNRFFGDKEALGRMLEITGKDFKVVGIIEEVPSNCVQAHASVYIPYTIKEGQNRDIRNMGDYSIAFRFNDREQRKAIENELDKIKSLINQMMEDGYEFHFGGPYDALTYYLIGWQRIDEYKGDETEILKVLGKMLLILLLPAINLISIQLIRVHERAEEIGVRKAFGASRGELIKQILYENLLLTFIGAILGLLLTIGIFYGFNDLIKSTLFADAGNNVHVRINLGLFFVSLIVALVLSFLSGLLPALKISKVETAVVLKGGNL
jgi:putative ABC transport system permease protein